uniref:RNA replicase n=1 Tax=Wenzhou noda-like virus 3 TaxID=1923587 RepID=A0A1L3KG16_9VIRU|nr:hypothetical protein [Wenzhou noda-like virus 3]
MDSVVFVGINLADGVAQVTWRKSSFKYILGAAVGSYCYYKTQQHLARYNARDSLAVYVVRAISERLYYYVYRILDRFTIRLNKGVRRRFQRNLSMVRTTVREGHSHQMAAAERNSATETALNTVRSMGMEPYVVSPSPREIDEAGCRIHYSMADLNQHVRWDEVTPNHVFVLIDVDYYVDMDYLLSHGNPVLMYTFQPETVSGVVTDGYFTIGANDLVTYRVSGGKDVTHQVWNYNQDVVMTEHHSGWWAVIVDVLQMIGLMPGVNSVCSHIDQFHVSKHRRMIAITPFAQMPLMGALYGTRLARCKYTLNDEFVGLISMVTTNEQKSPVMSVARKGDLANATVPLTAIEALKLSHGIEPSKHISDVVRRAKVDIDTACILQAYLLSLGPPPNVVVHAPGSFAKHYQVHGMDKPLDDGRPYARRFAAPPLSEESVFPTDCPQNNHASVEGRITKPQIAARKRQHIVARFYKYASEFVEHLVPVPHQGQPLTVQEVDDRQNKPAQRARSQQVHMIDEEEMVVRAFLKREAMATPNDARNISTVPVTHTLRLSSFTLAFKQECLVDADWYTPCKTPAQIAQRLMDIASRNENLRERDLSRMDGSELEFQTVYVQDAAYLRWCAPEHKDELYTLLTSEHRPQSRHKYGKYDPGWSKLSGSPTTTDGNTMKVAHADYCAARESGMGPLGAWEYVCQNIADYGDDGVEGDQVDEDTVKRVYSMLGFDLKFLKTVRRGNPVNFLGRVFVDLWSTPASIQSPHRTLMKLHTTTNRDLSVEEIGSRKCESYRITDGRTPFISNWINCYMRNVAYDGEVTRVPLEDIPFFTRRREDIVDTWPQTGEIPVSLVAEELECTESAIQQHMDLLDAYVGDVMEIPRFTIAVVRPKVDALVDSEIHEAGSIAENSTNPQQQEEQDGRYHIEAPHDTIRDFGHNGTRRNRSRRRSRTAARPNGPDKATNAKADACKTTGRTVAKPAQGNNVQAGQHAEGPRRQRNLRPEANAKGDGMRRPGECQVGKTRTGTLK